MLMISVIWPHKLYFGTLICSNLFKFFKQEQQCLSTFETSFECKKLNTNAECLPSFLATAC